MPVSGWGGRGDGVRQCRLLTFSNEFHHAQTCRADTCHRTIHRDSANLLSPQKKLDECHISHNIDRPDNDNEEAFLLASQIVMIIICGS